ncbi:ROK family transcriptional regulator [Streptomyces sp. 4N509B]|uniref:ROK family transcriptional regulator n=1 Tax=Streptomyces sp. 4N509B TaxID=3457413 RepID=UPI003FD05C73
MRWEGRDGVDDGQVVRRHNLASVLRELRAAGPRSRARIAAETGLTRAAVTSLVGELLALGLVRETQGQGAGHGGGGQALELDGRLTGLGVEVAVDHVTVLALDVRGEVLHTARTPLDVPHLGVTRGLDEVAAAVTAGLDAVATAASGHEVVGVTVGLPGLVETAPGALRHAPTLGWREVPIVDELAARLGPRRPPHLGADNAANLAALAEHATGSAAGVPDLVHITGETGVGGGIIADGGLLRGVGGYGGEIAHLPIGDPAHRCLCGRYGCWETAIGLPALLREVADPGDAVTDPHLDLPARLAEIRRRAELGDGRTLRGLDAIGTSLGVGAAILVDLLNPQVITLGGYFAVLGDLLHEPMAAELDKRAAVPGRGDCRVEPSVLGFTAACRGGALVALDAVLDDPGHLAPASGPDTVLAATPVAPAAPSPAGASPAGASATPGAPAPPTPPAAPTSPAATAAPAPNAPPRPAGGTA